MTSPLTTAQALANLHPSSHVLYNNLADSHLLPDEPIFATANWSSGSQSFGFLSVTWGIAVLTNHRFLALGIPLGMATGGLIGGQVAEKNIIRYNKGGLVSTLKAGFEFFIPEIHVWYIPSDKPLNNRQLREQSVFDVQLPLLVEQGIPRTDYHLKYKGDSWRFVHLWERAFLEKDGNHIYSLMQQALENGGKVLRGTDSETGASAGKEDVTRLIESLAKLHNAGVISDDEFLRKKTELLSRL